MLERTAPPPDSDRSIDSHRFFFACLGVAFLNWPANHKHFIPGNARDHLRAWLLCHDQVMHCGLIEARGDESELLRSLDLMKAEMSRIVDAGGHAFLWERPGLLDLRWPRTIRFEKNGGISKARFKDIAEKVYRAIYIETGIEVEALKKAARQTVGVGDDVVK